MPSERDPRADAQRQLDELVVGEAACSRFQKSSSMLLVVEGELLGELGAQPLALGEAGPVVLADVGVVLLVDVVGLGRRGRPRRWRCGSSGRPGSC